MNNHDVVKGADLFCGAGGTTLGFLRALRKLGLNVDMVAVNHWILAIETHKLNHPAVRHKHSNLERVNPLELVPSGHLHFLWASPECTYYSNALGGKPVNNQSRATPKWVQKWLSVLDVEKFGMENVPEFRNWGPVHRTCNCARKAKTYREALALLKEKKHEKKCHFQKPIKSRLGEYFYRYIRKFQTLGYHVEYRVLCAADYGAPTTRKRLFILGSKNGKVQWPEPTHHKNGGDMFGKKKPWKTARDHVIDWKVKGESIFFSEKYKKKPLSPRTMQKIMEGFYKFNGKAFMFSNQTGSRPWAIDQSPVPTLTANGSVGLFEPFMVSMEQTNANGKQVRKTNQPVPTVTGNARIGIAEPFIVTLDQGGNVRSVNRPVHTITSADATTLVQPYIIPCYGKRDNGNIRAHSVDGPMPSVVGSNSHGLAEPYLVEYYGNGDSHSTNGPVPTVTGNDRFGLAIPIVQDVDGNKYFVDIHYRMFTKKEYAKAQGFPKNYKFKGGSKDITKMIGNAVPPAFAEALTYENMKDMVLQ